MGVAVVVTSFVWVADVIVVGVIRGQTDYERYTWKEATYSLPNTKHSLPNME